MTYGERQQNRQRFGATYLQWSSVIPRGVPLSSGWTTRGVHPLGHGGLPGIFPVGVPSLPVLLLLQPISSPPDIPRRGPKHAVILNVPQDLRLRDARLLRPRRVLEVLKHHGP